MIRSCCAPAVSLHVQMTVLWSLNFNRCVRCNDIVFLKVDCYFCDVNLFIYLIYLMLIAKYNKWFTGWLNKKCKHCVGNSEQIAYTDSRIDLYTLCAVLLIKKEKKCKSGYDETRSQICLVQFTQLCNLILWVGSACAVDCHNLADLILIMKIS